MASRARPKSTLRRFSSPATPTAAYSMAAIIKAALGPCACTVCAETPAAAAIFAREVPVYPSAANSSPAMARICERVCSACRRRSSDRYVRGDCLGIDFGGTTMNSTLSDQWERRGDTMSSIIVASIPIHGHVAPLLTVAKRFVERGDDVRFITGARFADKVSATGATFVPLPAEADFDDRTLFEHRPERAKLKGVKALVYDFEHVFARPIKAQYDTLVAAHGARPAGAV